MKTLPPVETYEQGGLQEVQLEDGSTAYIQHTVHMPQPSTILAIQADGTIADLQTEGGAMDPETISVLEQYTTKVSLSGQSRRPVTALQPHITGFLFFFWFQSVWFMEHCWDVKENFHKYVKILLK